MNEHRLLHDFPAISDAVGGHAQLGDSHASQVA
jgi:hypothetical protein